MNRISLRLKNFLRTDDIKVLFHDIWSTSWPMTLIMFFGFLIGLADVFVAGKISKEVQAAYGFVFQVYFVSIVLASSLTVGAVSVISRLFTADKKEELSRAIYSSLIVVTACGIIFGCLGAFIAPRIIGLLNVPEVIKYYGIPLFRIYAFGLFFHYILISTNGILRSCKMVRMSLVTMTVVCLLNIVLDFYFVFFTKLGYCGIAAATVVSVFIGCLINIKYVWRFLRGVKRFSVDLAKQIINIGWPMLILQVAWHSGVMVLFLIVGFLPRHSIETLAAFTSGLRIESAIFLLAFGFNNSNAVILGNLIGKERKEEAFRSGIFTAMIGVTIVIVLSIIVIINARWIVSFLSGNRIVINEAVKYLYVVLIFEPFMAWSVILGGGLSGAGDTKSVMKIVVLSIWLIRIPLSYIFGIYLSGGAVTIWWAMNLSLLVQAFFISRRYMGKKWLRHV